MVKVAIAGGTNGVGLAIIEAIVATGKHDVFVLTRENSEKTLTVPSVTILKVDYSSISTIATLLKTHQIDTVISAVTLRDDESAVSQKNLIEAAAQSGTVRRFAPSEFGLDYAAAGRANFPFPGLEHRNAAILQLKTHPQLAYTRFVNGAFMDYLGSSNMSTPVNMMNLILDFENGKAVIPGTGNTRVVFTHTTTIGAFVAASLELDIWPEESFMKGDRCTLRELVGIAERVKGVKFDISYDSKEDMKAGKSGELPSNVPRYAYFPKEMVDMITQILGIAADDGMVDLEGPWLNDFLPGVEVLTLEGFFKKCLAGN